MKTLLIYLEEIPKYLIVEKNLEKFNGLMINHYNVDINTQNEFCEWFYDENGTYKYQLSEDIQIIESKNWDKVCFVTFLL